MSERELPMAACDLRDRIRRDLRNVTVILITLEPYLREPYRDDPRWTPWTRFGERAARWLDRTKSDVDALLAAHDAERTEAAEQDRDRWKARAEKLEANLRDLLDVAHPHARESPGLATVAHMAHAAVLNVCGICAKPLNQGDRGSIDCGGDCQECMDRHEEDG